MEHSIEIEGLNKSFGSVRAVHDLSFHVKTGELFAFLGVNGAGKSTTISILCGQLRKDSGRVTVCGESVDGDLGKITRRLGVVFQDSVLDQVLSVRDNLQSRAALYGITGAAFRERMGELARLLDFENLLGRTVGRLSGGQRRRIDIARALLHRPEILILDEPTTGLDPQTRRLLWNVVQDLRRREKMTVFLTTHYMEEAADADYVVILDSGKHCRRGHTAAAEKYLYGRLYHAVRRDGGAGRGARDAVRDAAGCRAGVGAGYRGGDTDDHGASGAVYGLRDHQGEDGRRLFGSDRQKTGR